MVCENVKWGIPVFYIPENLCSQNISIYMKKRDDFLRHKENCPEGALLLPTKKPGVCWDSFLLRAQYRAAKSGRQWLPPNLNLSTRPDSKPTGPQRLQTKPHQLVVSSISRRTPQTWDYMEVEENANVTDACCHCSSQAQNGEALQGLWRAELGAGQPRHSQDQPLHKIQHQAQKHRSTGDTCHGERA